MALTLKQRHKRLLKRIDDLRYWLDRDVVQLAGWTFNGLPISLDQSWPTLDGVIELRLGEAVVPEEWSLPDTYLDLHPGGESLVRVTYADGSQDTFGIDPNHERFPLRARSFSLSIASVARHPFGVPNRDARLGATRLVLVERDLLYLIRQLDLVRETVEALAEHEVVAPLLAAAERALAVLDMPSATVDVLSRTVNSSAMQHIWSLPPGLEPNPPGLTAEQGETVRAASAQLTSELQRLQHLYPPIGRLVLSGHAHIDLAWLWPMHETRRKAQRTFSTAIDLLRRYEEFRFVQSTAQLYQFLEEDDPELFARVKDWVHDGRWETVGGMWVEPDTNMPTGESLTRQLLYGQRYFARTFGHLHDICWVPDCFGFSPALPQLLRLAGMRTFFTIKLTWSETNPFPYDLFLWEGLDGSRVLAHMFDNPDGGYNGNPRPIGIEGTWEKFRARAALNENLLTIGYGDGGGGVSVEMLEDARVLRDFPVLPRLQFDSVRNFYDRTWAAIGDQEIPVWVGEMYLELHRGTLVSQSRMKYLHRRAEHDLVTAEVLCALNALEGSSLPRSLEEQWRIVLRNEFHDILPGSSIREVYQDAERELSEVIAVGQAVMQREMDEVANRVSASGGQPAVLVVNPSLAARPLRVQCAASLPGAQTVESGSVLSTPTTVPACGIVATASLCPAGGLSVSNTRLENDLIRVDLDEMGTVCSVWDKRSEREVLAGPGNDLWAYVDKPREWDAWDIDAGYAMQGEPITGVSALEVIEEGPHRVAIRIARPFRHSCITQEIRLWAGSARLDFHTMVDWHDRHWLVKAHFPLNVRTPRATFECAYGVIERPTHSNTSWEQARFEMVAHRFADLSEPGYGIALLNDGKYGHSVEGNRLSISLLRAPTYPDPLADEGRQTFTYALFPHPGSWFEGGVVREADDLNRPLLVRSVRVEEEVVRQPLRLEGLPVALGTLKVLEDGDGLVLRVYEPHGARGTVAVTLPNRWTVTDTVDLLERPVGDPQFGLRPFEVKSWRLARETSTTSP